MDELLSYRYATKEYVQARIAEAMHSASGGGGSAVLGPKSITANGVYNASSDGLDGYDQVTVNVPGTDPYTVGVGTIVLASDGVIVIPTPSIDSTQFVSVFFMARNYEQLANDLFAAGKKLSFGLRFSSFDEYYQKTGISQTRDISLRYGVDNTPLNYYSTANVSIGSDSITYGNTYAAATYDYVVIYQEAQE